MCGQRVRQAGSPHGFLVGWVTRWVGGCWFGKPKAGSFPGSLHGFGGAGVAGWDAKNWAGCPHVESQIFAAMARSWASDAIHLWEMVSRRSFLNRFLFQRNPSLAGRFSCSLLGPILSSTCLVVECRRASQNCLATKLHQP